MVFMVSFGNKREFFIKALEHFHNKFALELVPGPESTRKPVWLNCAAYYARLIDHAKTPDARLGCFMCNTAVELSSSDVAIAEQLDAMFEGLRGIFLNALRNGQAQGQLAADMDLDEYASYLLGVQMAMAMMVRSGFGEQKMQPVLKRGTASDSVISLTSHFLDSHSLTSQISPYVLHNTPIAAQRRCLGTQHTWPPESGARTPQRGTPRFPAQIKPPSGPMARAHRFGPVGVIPQRFFTAVMQYKFLLCINVGKPLGQGDGRMYCRYPIKLTLLAGANWQSVASGAVFFRRDRLSVSPSVRSV